MKKAAMFYCTTGWQDGAPSMVQPILAYSEGQAREWMHKRYNGRWATSYDSERWAEAVLHAAQHGYPIEKELPIVNLTGEVEETEEEN